MLPLTKLSRNQLQYQNKAKKGVFRARGDKLVNGTGREADGVGEVWKRWGRGRAWRVGEQLSRKRQRNEFLSL